MTRRELSQLAKHEAVIERGLTSFIEVGNALAAIRDGKLYLRQSPTFAEYLKLRWGLQRDRAYRLIDAAQVARNIKLAIHGSQALDNVALGLQILPVNERQARPLARIGPRDDPEKRATEQAEVWREVVSTAPCRNGKPNVTAGHVQKVARRYLRSTQEPEPNERVYICLDPDDAAWSARQINDAVCGDDDGGDNYLKELSTELRKLAGD